MKYLILFSLTTLFTLSTNAEKVSFNSGSAQKSLIELYTSEGCSSCPPADEFLGQFVKSDELWSKYIPLAFHVDYWDYLGWKDVFASAEFSNRQRVHKLQGNISSVYTPGFVVNGEEWAGFFRPWRSLPETDQNPGELEVSIDRHQVNIQFPAATKELNYNLAIVGVGLSTGVQSGENAGEELPHDFVVLDHQTVAGTKSASLHLPIITRHQPEQFAVVAWVTERNTLRSIQAVGGYLPEGTIKTL